MTTRRLLIGALTLAAAPIAAAAIATALMWCVHEWNWPDLVVALAGGGLFIGLLFVSSRFARRIVDRRFCFSIREMLAGVAAIGLLLATLGRWWLNFAHEYGAIRSVNAFGAYVDDGRGYLGHPRNGLYSWIGYDPFDKSRDLVLPNDFALQDVLRRPDRFLDTAGLSFYRGVTSAGFEHSEQLNRFSNLWCGQFMMSAIGDAGLERLRDWTNVRLLFFNGCPNVTDAGLAHLVELPKLENFSLVEEGGGMIITDAGLVHVGQMKGLKKLMLKGLKQVTDAGLVHVYGLSNLEDLSLDYTGITTAGLQRLYDALPDCRIITFPVVAPGPQNVRRIIVKRIASPNERAEICDAARIGEIVNLIEASTASNSAGNLSDRRLDEPWPASFELSLMGKSRELYRARIGDGALQTSYRTRWNKWIINRPDEEKLKQLISVPGEQRND